jgi:hypothetical protein
MVNPDFLCFAHIDTISIANINITILVRVSGCVLGQFVV